MMKAQSGACCLIASMTFNLAPDPWVILPKEDLGGGDICSIEREPSTEDDQPL